MQPSFLPSQTASSGVHGWSPLTSGITLLNTAYHWWTGTPMAAPPLHADAEAGLTGPNTALSADMAALLGLRPDPGRSDFKSVRTKRERASAQNRTGSLDPQRALVGHWLAQPLMVTRLSEIGLRVADVEACLQRNIADFERGLPARVRAGDHDGLVTFPRKPRAHDLFAYSVRDAMRNLAARELRAAELAPPVTTSRPAAPESAQTVALPAEPPGVDLAQREKALAQVRQFRANLGRRLPFFGEDFSTGFWRLAIGRAELAELSWAIEAVPCVTSLHPVSGGVGAVYPSPGDDALRMHHVMIRRKGEVFLSRTADGHHVRYSLNQGLTWTDTDVYTDDVVEAEKTQLWAAVIRSNKRAQSRHILAARWMKW